MVSDFEGLGFGVGIATVGTFLELVSTLSGRLMNEGSSALVVKGEA